MTDEEVARTSVVIQQLQEKKRRLGGEWMRRPFVSLPFFLLLFSDWWWRWREREGAGGGEMTSVSQCIADKAYGASHIYFWRNEVCMLF